MEHPPPGRPYGLRQEVARILRKIAMPSLGSISDRLRTMKSSDADWAQAMEKRLDAIDDMKAKALPVIEREMQTREYDAHALENDAMVMKQMAEEILGNSPKSAQGSAASGTQNGNAAVAAKPSETAGLAEVK